MYIGRQGIIKIAENVEIGWHIVINPTWLYRDDLAKLFEGNEIQERLKEGWRDTPQTPAEHLVVIPQTPAEHPVVIPQTPAEHLVVIPQTPAEHPVVIPQTPIDIDPEVIFAAEKLLKDWGLCLKSLLAELKIKNDYRAQNKYKPIYDVIIQRYAGRIRRRRLDWVFK